MSVRSRFAWLVTFAVALGWFEGAVVVYLRELAYPDGFSFPVAPLPPHVLGTEVAREAASLLIMAAVAVLAGTTRLQRVAGFFVIFGVWDLVYYATLWLVLRWPESLATPDVLFLIPTVWVGPVWAPALVALVFVVGGGRVFLTPAAPRGYRWHDWLVECTAGVLIALSFMSTGTSIEAASPDAFSPGLYWLGLALGVGYYLRLEWRSGRRLAS